MEINVGVAVRISPTICNNEEMLCVKPNLCNNTINLNNSHIFPVHYALPHECSQSTLFALTVTPLLNYLFEGCDVSVVTFGQAGCGKSYTLLGPDLSCILSECEYGVIPRFVREVFAKVCQNNDRNYLIYIAWTQIFGENVKDLLGSGSVECASVSEAFEFLRLGMSNISERYSHTLFTITFEQQWVEGSTVQHRISTASFIDLSSGEKVFLMDSNGLTQTVSKDNGLLTLQRCIWALTEPYVSLSSPDSVPYNQSALTMLLRDSFGGRAKTLLICCVSPLLSDYMESFYTLQFAMCAQMVKNFVTINSYTTLEMPCENMDVFSLQFAANQLFKLVSNAEYLFKNLIVNSSLTKSQSEQISRWLILKQECKDCINESSEPQRSLDIIEEEIEVSSTSEISEVPGEDDQQGVFQNTEELMRAFYSKTDNVVDHNNLKTNSNASKDSSGGSLNNEYRLKGARGRRASIHSVEEFVPLKIIEPTSTKSSNSINCETKSVLKQISTEIEGCEKQIKETEAVIQIKEKLLQHLHKYKNTNVSAKDKLKQKHQQLHTQQEVVRSKLEQAKSDKDYEKEQKYHSENCKLSQKLEEAEMIKDVCEDDSKKISELESSLRHSKKQLVKLKRHKLKEEKLQVNYQNELKRDSLTKSKNTNSTKSESPTICSHNKVYNELETDIEDLENLRHEIKELRKTRDIVLEQICKVDTKTHNKLLNDLEEYNMLQCEEAIEAVDMAIEYKNQLICCCTDTNVCNMEQEDKIGKILMEQFMKLHTDEIRVLLKSYFQKVINLRIISKKLEHQVIEVEYQNENLHCRIQNMSHTLQRLRLETECRILSLQQQYENKLQLVMRQLDDGYTPDENVMSQVVERSKQAALAFQVTQRATKQIDKGSLIARFTRYARQETVPRQLQAAITPPQAKVTRQKNKLIIQQSSK